MNKPALHTGVSDMSSTNAAANEALERETQPALSAPDEFFIVSLSADSIEGYTQYVENNHTTFADFRPQTVTFESLRSPFSRLTSRIWVWLRCESTDPDLLPSYAAATAEPQSFFSNFSFSFSEWHLQRERNQLEKKYATDRIELTRQQDSKILELEALKQSEATNNASPGEYFTKLRELFYEQDVEYKQLCDKHEQILAKKSSAIAETPEAPPPSYTEAFHRFRVFPASPPNDAHFYHGRETHFPSLSNP